MDIKYSTYVNLSVVISQYAEACDLPLTFAFINYI